MGNTGGRPFSYSSVYDFQLQTELRDDSWAIFQSDLPTSTLDPDTAILSAFDSEQKNCPFATRVLTWHKTLAEVRRG